MLLLLLLLDGIEHCPKNWGHFLTYCALLMLLLFVSTFYCEKLFSSVIKVELEIHHSDDYLEGYIKITKKTDIMSDLGRLLNQKQWQRHCDTCNWLCKIKLLNNNKTINCLHL